MKNAFIPVLLFISSLADAQKPVVIIHGTIKGLKEGSQVWLVPNKPDISKDSAIVKNGQFQFKYPLTWAGSYSLRLSRGFEPGKWRNFYIGIEGFDLKASDTLFANLKTWGSQYALEYNNYNGLLEAKHIFQKRIRISKIGAEANANNDTLLAKKSFLEYLEMDSMQESLSRQWIKAHPASVISSFILYNDFYNSASIGLLDTLLTKLRSGGRNNSLFIEMQEAVAAQKAASIGKMAPLFIQNDDSGNPFSLESLRGQYVLIDFWASWCVPCRAENPYLIAAYNKFREKGFTVVGVSLDDSREKWLEAIGQDALPWTQVSDLRSWENEVSRKYYITSVPANFLIAPDGRIIAKNLRGADLDNYLSDLFK